MITATTTLMRMRMILQDGNSPVALRVVAGRVEERDADHRHRRGDRQRRDPPGNYQGRCRKSWTKVGFWEIDLRRNPMRPAQPRIIWKIADTAIAPWISRILTWSQLLIFSFLHVAALCRRGQTCHISVLAASSLSMVQLSSFEVTFPT